MSAGAPSRARPPLAHATVIEGPYEKLQEPPQNQAAVMPDGSLVMLSPSNPYGPEIAKARRIDNNESAIAEGLEAYRTLYQPALALEHMARVVRMLAMFDMLFSLMRAFADMWPAVIATVMSYCGYLGARTFRRDLTRIYLYYLVTYALIRLIFAVSLAFRLENHHVPGGKPLVQSADSSVPPPLHASSDPVAAAGAEAGAAAVSAGSYDGYYGSVSVYMILAALIQV